MTNLRQANGTLKIVNRKFTRDGVSGVSVAELEAAVGASLAVGQQQLAAATAVAAGPKDSSRQPLPVIMDEDLKENRADREQQQQQQQLIPLANGNSSRLKQRNKANGAAAANGAANGLGKQAEAERQARAGEEKAATAANEKAPEEFKAQIVWFNIMLFVILHSAIPIGIYQLYTQRPWLTIAWSVLGMYMSGLGVTGGAHRLWSHRSYKASLSVEILLMCLQTMAGQNSIYTWCRDHRVHHKFSETDADPHNIKRGFFFAHMGWLCCRKHPEVKEKGKLIDMSDLEANRVVMFQHRHFWWLAILFTVLLPTMVPVMLWRERFWTSFIYSFMLRYLITLHGTWLVNSAAHYFGSRPYDERMEARESPFVIATGLGEGFHNYHHTFPYDYSTSEFGKYFNITTAFIDACAALSLVHDRRKMDRAMVASRMARTGEKAADGAGQMAASKC